MKVSNFLDDSLSIYQAVDGGNQLGDAMLNANFYTKLTSAFSLTATIFTPSPFGVGLNIAAIKMSLAGW